VTFTVNASITHGPKFGIQKPGETEMIKKTGLAGLK